MPRIALTPYLACVLAPAALAALTGCSSLQSSDNFLGVITPYRVEIVQGNVVTREQVAALKPGMSREEVRDILGSPLITDAFHADRWDYVFTIKRQGTAPQSRRVLVRFDGNAMKSVEASEDLPGEREFAASITPPRLAARGTPPTLELTEEQRKALPAPARDSSASTQPLPAGPTRTYPPLEATP